MNKLRILKKLFSLSFYYQLPDKIIIRSNWYKNIFNDAERILKIPQHLDIINLGSNPAKFGLDYSESNVKGYNLAVGPQTLSYDFEMLKNYHSYFNEKGPRILLLFCPFSLCKDVYTKEDGDVYKDLRYYPILHKASIAHYDDKLYETWIRHPHKLGLKTYFRIVRHFRRNKIMQIDFNPLSEKQMKQSALEYIKNWKAEFFLSSLNPEHLSDRVLSSLTYNSHKLDEIKDFCKERDINPIIVLPPLSPELNEIIPSDMKERCTYSILRNKGLLLLDYTEDIRFCKNEYFLDALKLNKKGRILFTNQLIKDLKEKGIFRTDLNSKN